MKANQRLRRPQAPRAFTRLELMAVLAILSLGVLVALPVLGEGKLKSQVAVCVNNLRSIGRAILTWDVEHGDTDPWRWPRPQDVQASGVFNNSWYQYSLISNELATPRILACPSDTRRLARDWSSSPDGGFLHSAYRNKSVSYFLGLDTHVSVPDSILGGDPNLVVQTYSACSSGLNPVPALNPYATPGSHWGWTNAVHGLQGNILFHDGRVQLLRADGLLQAFETPADNSYFHELIP